MPSCHCVAVGAPPRGMWRTGRTVADLPKGLNAGMDEYAGRGAGQVTTAGCCCRRSGCNII